MKKNPQAKDGIFWIFTDFHEVSASKAQPAPPHRNVVNGVANPEIVYMLLLFQILCIDWFFLFFIFFLKFALKENSLNI